MIRPILILPLILAAGTEFAPAMAENGFPAQASPAASGATPPAVEARFTPAERELVADAVAANLKRHYFDKAVAQKTAVALLASEKAGNDSSATDGETFAALLTRQMRDVSRDMHLEVIYSQDPRPANMPEPTVAERAQFRKRIEDQNCLIENVEVLPHNIGYFKLNWFPDPSICGEKFKSSLASLNDADAVIFDLRDARGADPAMVPLIGAYLFDHPEYWYSPREAPSANSWTHSPVEGNKLADKPVYVLTSHTTLSGAEQFTYDLKMLKRATIVGETTGGEAHAGAFHRVDDNFGFAIPEVRGVNPYGKNDWEGTGVEPDVKVKAADALEAARKLAESRVRTE